MNWWTSCKRCHFVHVSDLPSQTITRRTTLPVCVCVFGRCDSIPCSLLWRSKGREGPLQWNVPEDIPMKAPLELFNGNEECVCLHVPTREDCRSHVNDDILLDILNINCALYIYLVLIENGLIYFQRGCSIISVLIWSLSPVQCLGYTKLVVTGN